MSIQFVNIKDDEKKIILDILGYEVGKDGLILLKENKKAHICPLTEEKVYFKDASILPWNSNIVINTTALTISEYLSKMPKKLRENCG